MGDVGQTADSAATFQHLVASAPQSILDVGDISYAGAAHQPSCLSVIRGARCAWHGHVEGAKDMAENGCPMSCKDGLLLLLLLPHPVKRAEQTICYHP